MSYYASITDAVGRTAVTEETARKTVKLREFISFCKLGKDRKDSISLVEHLCPPSVNWCCTDGTIHYFGTAVVITTKAFVWVRLG